MPNGPFIVHIGDAHLDYKNKEVQAVNREQRNIREYDFFLAFERVVRQVLAMPERPLAVVIAGDLLDTPRPTGTVMRAIIELLYLLEAAGIRVIIIAGNHDTPQMRTTTSGIQVLEAIEFENITFAYDAIKRVVIGPCEFVLLPHLPLSEGFDPSEIAPDLENNEYSVLVAHGVAESEGSTLFRQLDEQREMPIASHLLTMGHTYVALGHYHGMTEVRPRVWYSGSLENTSYGREAKHKRGYLVVRLDECAADDRYRPEIVETPVRRVIEPQPIDAAGMDAAAVEAAFRDAVPWEEVPEAMVKVVVRNISRDVYAGVDKVGLRALGKEALHFKDEWDIRQVESRIGDGTEKIRSLDVEYGLAVDAYYAAHGEDGLPPKDGVLELGTRYILTYMEIEADDD